VKYIFGCFFGFSPLGASYPLPELLWRRNSPTDEQTNVSRSDEKLIHSDLGVGLGVWGFCGWAVGAEGRGHQANIPETWRRRALCHML